MKRQQLLIGVLALGLLLALAVGLTHAQGAEPQGELSPQADPVGTAFTYQGYLTDGGSPANGDYDFEFELYDDPDTGTQVGDIVTVDGKIVTDSLFTVELDFGSGIFTGEALYLEIGVRPGGSTGAYTTLSPRQALTPAPYALALPGLRTQQNATSPNVIGGYSGNSVTAGKYGATIGGGGESGYANQVTEIYGTVSGGVKNTASNEIATVGGGYNNEASGEYATVSGGHANAASGYKSTIGGGYVNEASGEYATVGGGSLNTASGEYATVAGGRSNTAQGDYSFAAGRRANADYPGCFVWGDSTDADLDCLVENRWAARASGGVWFYSSGDLSSGVRLGGGANAWGSVGARERKENFEPVDAQELLARLAEIEISTWNYKSQDSSIRHIGPMADEFSTLVDGLGGEGEDYISTIDADGVALAAIQGLYAQNQALQAENAAQQEQIADLEARITALEAALSSLQGDER